MSKSFGVQFKGFDEQVQKMYQMVGSELKPVIEDCLKFIPDKINPNLTRDMKRHTKYSSGRTLASLETENPITWSGTEASIPVGFHIRRGGLPSVFLMYGTARHAPNNPGVQQDVALHDDIMGDRLEKEIANEQKRIYDRGVKKIWGG